MAMMSLLMQKIKEIKAEQKEYQVEIKQLKKRKIKKNKIEENEKLKNEFIEINVRSESMKR